MKQATHCAARLVQFMKISFKQAVIAIIVLLVSFVGFIVVTRSFTLGASTNEEGLTTEIQQRQLENCGTGAPKEDFIHFERADAARDGTPIITDEKALEIASRGAYVKSQLPAPATRVQYVLYTNDVQGIAKTPGDDDDADRHLLYQKVPAMLVTFCGVSVMPVSRKPVAAPGELAPLKAVATEWNYVIDAMTGETLIQFGSNPRK